MRGYFAGTSVLATTFAKGREFSREGKKKREREKDRREMEVVPRELSKNVSFEFLFPAFSFSHSRPRRAEGDRERERATPKSTLTVRAVGNLRRSQLPSLFTSSFAASFVSTQFVLLERSSRPLARRATCDLSTVRRATRKSVSNARRVRRAARVVTPRI